MNPTPSPHVRVWDRFVRLFHWLLVASFFTAWLSTEHIGWVHKGAGYLAVALVLARIAWGFASTGHARFAGFVPRPLALWAYTAQWLRGREPRHLGHNPMGAVMVLYLLAAMLTIGMSGWMMTLDAFWGNDVVETVHTTAVDVSLLAVALHVGANLLAGLRHGENLVLAMFTGCKPAHTARGVQAEPTASGRGHDLSAAHEARASRSDSAAYPG